MINELNKLGEKITWKVFLLIGVLFLAMLWLIDFSPIGCATLYQIAPGAQLLDYDCCYSLEVAYGKLAAMGEMGRDFYLNKVLLLDIFYPPTFMLLQFAIYSMLSRKATKETSKARLLPLLAIGYLIGDWGENIGIFLMLKNYPAQLAGVCAYTSAISTLKILCIFGGLISIIVLTILCIVKQLKSKKTN